MIQAAVRYGWPLFVNFFVGGDTFITPRIELDIMAIQFVFRKIIRNTLN